MTMKYELHLMIYPKKKKFSEGRIRMLNLTLKVLRSVVKGRNTGSYKSMPKNQLINLINH